MSKSMIAIEKKVPALSVETVVKELSSLYIPAINAGMPLAMFPAPFLWGPPGVGKSDAIKQIADNIQRETGKKVVITDIRLLLYSPIDLRGVPVADEHKQYTNWLMPKVFALDPSEDVINLMFLDELSAAPQSVQAAAYQITLNRAIGEHKLPENTIIVAAGNRVTDASVAYRMPNALANRLMHYEISVDLESWRKWAIQNQVNPLVLGFLSFHAGMLFQDKVEMDEVAFPTPRSWMYVSNILNALGEGADVNKARHLIAGCVGNAVASEFIGYCKVKDDLPNIEDIFKGKDVTYPTTLDALYALVSSMVTYVVNGARPGASYKITDLMIDYMCLFVDKFPMDFATLLYTSLVEDANAKKLLIHSLEFKEWSKKNRKAMSKLDHTLI